MHKKIETKEQLKDWIEYEQKKLGGGVKID